MKHQRFAILLKLRAIPQKVSLTALQSPVKTPRTPHSFVGYQNSKANPQHAGPTSSGRPDCQYRKETGQASDLSSARFSLRSVPCVRSMQIQRLPQELKVLLPQLVRTGSRHHRVEYLRDSSFKKLEIPRLRQDLVRRTAIGSDGRDGISAALKINADVTIPSHWVAGIVFALDADAEICNVPNAGIIGPMKPRQKIRVELREPKTSPHSVVQLNADEKFAAAVEHRQELVSQLTGHTRRRRLLWRSEVAQAVESLDVHSVDSTAKFRWELCEVLERLSFVSLLESFHQLCFL